MLSIVKLARALNSRSTQTFGSNANFWSILLATAFAHEHMLSSSSTAVLSAAEDVAEKEVRRLTLMSSGRDAASQVPNGEWEAMTWVERLARLKSAESADGAGGAEVLARKKRRMYWPENGKPHPLATCVCHTQPIPKKPKET